MFSGKVLIIDDEEGIRDILAEIILELGFEVERVSNGKAAFEIIQNTQFDIVISDVSMPEMSGTALLMNLHEYNLVPDFFYFITGGMETSAEEFELSEHITGFIQKPFSEQDIVMILKETYVRKAAN